MEAEVADELPPPPGWSYEPKWDGFRVIVWSGPDPDGDGRPGPRLDSRNAKPLLRYFPELEPALWRLPPGTVADGEIVVVIDGKLNFDALQNRIHPAESRVRLLASETPAQIALFDLLALDGEDLRRRPLRERRDRLNRLAAALGSDTATSPWLLSPSTTDLQTAQAWFRDFEAAGFDGIVAKALDRPYAEGRREMIKVKHRRTVDCVVGGYRLRKDGKGVGSLLLGLYNREGELHFIGHCSSFDEAESVALLGALQTMHAEESGAGREGSGSGATVGFGEHARRPGGQSRWSGEKDLDYVAVGPELVIEISYNQLTGDRFRHATRFERWRPDKDPRDCTMDQLERPGGPGLGDVLGRAGLD
jgi:ATP-dependent DNA ligase